MGKEWTAFGCCSKQIRFKIYTSSHGMHILGWSYQLLPCGSIEMVKNKETRIKLPQKETRNFKSTQSAQLLEIHPLERADAQEHKLVIRRDLLWNMYKCIYTHTHTHTYIKYIIHTHIYIIYNICVYICIFIYLHVWTNINSLNSYVISANQFY